MIGIHYLFALGNIVSHKRNESVNKNISSTVNEIIGKYGSESDKTEIGIILDKTPCYSLEGGQISDKGFISIKDLNFNVTNVKKINRYVIHYGNFLQTDLK